MRKYSKFIIVAGALVALAAPSAALANSSNMTASGGNGVVSGTYLAGSSQGGKDNQSVTQYKASYVDSFFGPVSCVGTHHNAVTGKAAAAAFDSFTCTSTSGSPLTGVTPNQTLSLGTIGGWVSDFDGHSAMSYTGTVSANGMSYTATATY